MKYVQAAKHGGAQTHVNRVVVHCTVSPCVRGGALAVARYFQSRNAGGSAHYTVDPGEIVASLRENVVAYHAPPNTGSIGIELCDPQKGPDARWDDEEHQEMLRLAAGLVRRVADRWDDLTLIGFLPDWVETIIVPLLPTAIASVAAYKAKHTPRPDLPASQR